MAAMKSTPEREIRHEMGVHHVHVEVIHAVAFELFDVAFEIHQVGAHDRYRYFSFVGLHGVYEISFPQPEGRP